MTPEEIALRSLWKRMAEDGTIDHDMYDGNEDNFVEQIMEIFRKVPCKPKK